ncbi:MAG TPA: hypothetical protein VM055_05100 [Novosphingobium sp.]|nr:hypothetical protein [Novosphingobium sp.]
MKANRAAALFGLILLSACAAKREVAPAAVAAPPPRPVVDAPPAPAPDDWRDAPITPGAWSYAAQASGSTASFGSANGTLLSLRCDPAAGRIVLIRAGAASGPVPLAIVTTSLTRAFSTLAPPAGTPAQLAVSFAPSDAFLNDVAFSRGRFAVEAPGQPTLYAPAAAEIGRVVEDCR